MKSLISVNNKFTVLRPRELTELIANSKYTKGIEMCINNDSEYEKKYLEDIVFELKKHGLILQIHGDVELDFDKQIEYMRTLEKYSEYLGYPIVVTLHTVYDENEEVSLKKTIEYIGNLLNEIDNEKIIIGLENLNDARGFFRPGKESIKPIVLNDDRLYFTYDIGHEIADYGNITNLNEYMIEEIRNIHIHTNDGHGNDHKPIYKNDIHWNEIMKGLIFLINNEYQYNIVYEYDLFACRGNDTKERVIDYLNSIDFVSEKYSDILDKA